MEPYKPGAQACPTKYAFRWIRGLAGWQRSPMGKMFENDAVPSEPMEDDVQHGLLALGDSADRNKAIPLADQAAVERQAGTWAQLWRAEEQYSTPSFHLMQRCCRPCFLVLSSQQLPLFHLALALGVTTSRQGPSCAYPVLLWLRSHCCLPDLKRWAIGRKLWI